jgi:hypothetical protein
MGIIDFKVDFSNQKVLGAIVRCFLDIPRWLKILVVLSFVGAIVYFGFCQGYLYNDQLNELKRLQVELAETKQKMDNSVLNLEIYNQDYEMFIREFILIKEMNDELVEMHDEQINLFLEYLKHVNGPSRELSYLENSLRQNKKYFRQICSAYFKRSLLFKDVNKTEYLVKSLKEDVVKNK